MSPCSHRGTRRGFVLISALMLGVVLISCATAFTWFVRTQMRGVLQERVALTNRSMAQVFTLAIIKETETLTSRTKADSLNQPWFKPFLIPVEDLGTWVFQLRPLDDKLPIRSVFLPDGNTQRMEMKTLWEDMWDALRHRELALPVLDFLDRDNRGRVGGVERQEFLNRVPLDLSELLIMEEITPDILYGGAGTPGLADFCTVWSDGKINLNVAPLQVLRILPGLDSVLAGRLVDYRQERLLTSMEDLQEIQGFTAKTSTQLTNLAAFKSRYFSLDIQVLDDSPGGTAFHIIFDKTTRKVVYWEES